MVRAVDARLKILSDHPDWCFSALSGIVGAGGESLDGRMGLSCCSVRV